MIKVSRALKTSCVLAAACYMSVWTTRTARAQVMDQVPSDALVVLKINKLADTNGKVTDLLQSLGVTDLVPTLKDPLASAEAQLGLGAGLDVKRDAAAVMLNGTFEKDVPPPFVLLLPVSDYKAFLGTVTLVRTEGDVSVVHFKDNEDDAFIESWGDYAAISDKKENVVGKHDGLKLKGISAKQMDEKDECVFVNFPVLKAVLLPKLKEGADHATEEIDKNTQNMDAAKQKVAQAALKQGVAAVTEFLNDAEGATMGLSLEKGGIASNMIVELTPDSYLGKLAIAMKSTDQSLLTGLPKENYFVTGGYVEDTAVMEKTIDDLVGPIVTELGGMGDDGKKLITVIDAYKQMIGGVDSATFGVVAPTAALGQGSLFRFLGVYKGDVAKFKDAIAKMTGAQNDVMKAFGMGGQADLLKTTVTPNFKTLDGVAFDRIQSEVNPDNTSPEAMRASETMSQIYGPDGASALLGGIDAKTFISALGIDDDVLTQSIDAAKGDKDVLTDGLKDVDSGLPKKRAAAAYLGLGQIVTTALSYAKANGMNMPVQLPNNLPPVGFTFGTDGPVMRFDSYLPTKLLQSLVQAGMQGYMAFHGGGNGGGGL